MGEHVVRILLQNGLIHGRCVSKLTFHMKCERRSKQFFDGA